MTADSVKIGPVGERAAQNIAALRGLARLKQQELAERVRASGRQMSGSTISKIEKLDRRIDVDDLHALAQALGVSVPTLLEPLRVEGGQTA